MGDKQQRLDEEPAGHPDPRFVWAAERTFLAWLRTAIALMGFGFVVARFGLLLRELRVDGVQAAIHESLSAQVGTAMVASGVVLTVIAAQRYQRARIKLIRGEPLAGDVGFVVGVTIATSIIGVVLTAVLVLSSPLR